MHHTKSTLQIVLEKLDSPRKSGCGWVAKCPAHDDKSPSLSVSLASDGKVLVKCFAGCSFDSIVAALRLRACDLFPGDQARPSTNRRTQSVKVSTARRADPSNAKRFAPSKIEADFAAHQRDATPQRIDTLARKLAVTASAIEAVGVGFDDDVVIFPERNERGAIVGLLRRWPNGDKKIRTGDSRGLTIPQGFQDRSGPVYVTEGASDCLAALSLGLRAIGRPNTDGGAAELVELLAAVPDEVIVIADNDEPGRRGAAKVAREIADGLGRSVSILSPPEADKDLRETLSRCGSTDLALKELLVRPRIEVKPNDETGGDETLGDKTSTDGAENRGYVTTRCVHTPFIPFPVEVLPVAVRGLVEAGSGTMGVDPTFLAFPALATLAGAIGTSRRVRLRSSWCEFPILWNAIVAPSGSLKSPAQDLALRAIREAQRDRVREFETAMVEYDHNLATFDAQKAQVQKSKSTCVPLEKPVPPVCRRYVISDCTTEAVVGVLKDNPRGLLLARDELAAWIGGMDRYAKSRGGDLPFWLESHRGGSLIVDRKTGDRPTTFIASAAISITGSIQPGVFKRVFTRELFDAGLVARLCIAFPPARARRWRECDVSDHVLVDFAACVDRLLALDHGIGPDGKLGPVDLELTRDAKERFVGWYNDHADRTATVGNEFLGAHYSKLEAVCPRLALIFALVEGRSAVGVADIEAAITVTDWLAYESARVYGLLDRDATEMQADALVEHVRRRGGSITVRELQRGPRRFRGTPEEMRGELDRLVKAGVGRWVHPIPGSSGGRPEAAFELTSHTETGRGDESSGDTSPGIGPVAGGFGTNGFVTTANDGDPGGSGLDPESVIPPNPGDGNPDVPPGWSPEAWAAACEATHADRAAELRRRADEIEAS